MTVIAVAGGSGGVKREGLSQKIQNAKIDYDDIPGMVHELERHKIHTIISAIGLVSDETSRSQLNLIEAAEKSAHTKRFVPSEYSFIQTAHLLSIDPSIQWWLDAAERLKSSSLEYTRVIPGFFMDYWGMPHVKTHLQPFSFGIDISSGTAAIPGNGNNVICMTYTYDMATYLVRALDLDKWPEFSVIVGDEVTYNQLLGMAEEFTGNKFRVTYDSIEKIEAGDVTVPPQPEGMDSSSDELKEVTALVSRLTVSNVFELPKDRLNTLFPEVQPLVVREFLRTAWKRSSA